VFKPIPCHFCQLSFTPRNSLQRNCPGCISSGVIARAATRAWSRENPEKVRAYNRAWSRENPEKRRGYSRTSYHKNPEKKCAASNAWYYKNIPRSRDSRLRRVYGISLVDYNRLLASQCGTCAICHRLPPAGKVLHVDHDHTSGKVRGLLCALCNIAVGSEDAGVPLADVTTYVRRHRDGYLPTGDET
jgi:hypothetical protein